MRSKLTSFTLTTAMVLVGAATTLSANPRILCVDDDAIAAGDGSSWQTAYKFLQDALAAAQLAEKPLEVRVAQGLYRPDQGAGLQAGDTKATFRMRNGVTIKGGYAGPGGPDPNAWDPALYETLLWGDLQDNDDFTDPRTLFDNIQHLLTADETDATAVLEGVTIAHGADMRLNVRVMRTGGGGIYNRAGSPTIRHCTFSGNATHTAWGAAMLNYEGAAPHLEQCTFRNNYGLPVLYDQESTTVLTNCRFIENYGVAVGEQTSQVHFDNCSFTDNGGVALSVGKDSHATVSNCLFTGNHNAISGDSVLCTDCVFTGNTDRQGPGAVAVGTGIFIRCRFRDNSGGIGGAIYGTRLTLEDCAFVHNVAGAYGAIGCAYVDIHGCLFAGNRGKGVVGALYISEQGKLTNCTIVGNRSMLRGAVDHGHAETEMVITNCIIRDNPSQDTSWREEFIYSRRTTASFSCMVPLPWQLEGLGPVAVGLMDVDPCFVDPGYWDPNGTADDPNDDFWVEGDYHLKSQAGHWDPNSQSWVKDEVISPCIDAGDPNSPIGDEPQPNGGRVNMGVYGGTAEASKSPDATPVFGGVIYVGDDSIYIDNGGEPNVPGLGEMEVLYPQITLDRRPALVFVDGRALDERLYVAYFQDGFVQKHELASARYVSATQLDHAVFLVQTSDGHSGGEVFVVDLGRGLRRRIAWSSRIHCLRAVPARGRAMLAHSHLGLGELRYLELDLKTLSLALRHTFTRAELGERFLSLISGTVLSPDFQHAAYMDGDVGFAGDCRLLLVDLPAVQASCLDDKVSIVISPISSIANARPPLEWISDDQIVYRHIPIPEPNEVSIRLDALCIFKCVDIATAEISVVLQETLPLSVGGGSLRINPLNGELIYNDAWVLDPEQGTLTPVNHPFSVTNEYSPARAKVFLGDELLYAGSGNVSYTLISPSRQSFAYVVHSTSTDPDSTVYMKITDVPYPFEVAKGSHPTIPIGWIE